jgi:hypothetical protein
LLCCRRHEPPQAVFGTEHCQGASRQTIRQYQKEVTGDVRMANKKVKKLKKEIKSRKNTIAKQSKKLKKAKKALKKA